MTYNDELGSKICDIYKLNGNIVKTAELLKISRGSIYNWTRPGNKLFQPEFYEMWKKTKKERRFIDIEELKKSLLDSAKGELVEETKEEYLVDKDGKLTGDKKIIITKKKVRSIQAGIFMLCNLDKTNFQQRNEIEQKISGVLNLTDIDIKLNREQTSEYIQRVNDYLKQKQKENE